MRLRRSFAAARSAADRRRASDRRNRAGWCIGLPPQKKKSWVAGSPIGQRQVSSFSSSKVRRCPIGMMFSIGSGSDSDVEVIGIGERGIAADRGARDAQHMGLARLARPRRGGGRALGAARQPEPVHLADHRVAGDPAKLGGDLAGRQPVGPQFLELLDPFVRPRHECLPSWRRARFWCCAESIPGARQPFWPPDVTSRW